MPDQFENYKRLQQRQAANKHDERGASSREIVQRRPRQIRPVLLLGTNRPSKETAMRLRLGAFRPIAKYSAAAVPERVCPGDRRFQPRLLRADRRPESIPPATN